MLTCDAGNWQRCGEACGAMALLRAEDGTGLGFQGWGISRGEVGQPGWAVRLGGMGRGPWGAGGGGSFVLSLLFILVILL